MREGSLLQEIPDDHHAAIKLYCFPYAGGSANVFRSWQRLLPEWIRVQPVELPGHGWRMHEPLITDCPALVNQLACELATEPIAGAYAVFGHSAGAALALVVAAQLERLTGRRPMHCFLSAAGHLGAPKKPRAHLSDQDLLAELRGLGGTPERLLDEPELMEILLPIVRADFQVFEQSVLYRDLLVPYPLTLFAASDDALEPEQVWGWQKHTTAACRQVLLRGDHFAPVHEPEELISQTLMDLIAAVDNISAES